MGGVSVCLLKSLSELYARCVEYYLVAPQDFEGTENGDEFRSHSVMPMITSILGILTSLLSSSPFRDWVYATDVAGIVAAICAGCGEGGGNLILHNVEAAKKEPFFSVKQIAPLVSKMCETCFDHMSKLSDFDLHLAILRFVHMLLFFQVELYLRLKGEMETVDLNDVKGRDVQLAANDRVMREAEVTEMFRSLSEKAFEVMKQDRMEGKRAAAFLKANLPLLVRLVVVFAKEPMKRLALLVEVGMEVGCDG